MRAKAMPGYSTALRPKQENALKTAKRRGRLKASKMKLKVYIDTSVFSAFFDDRAPDRKSLTEQFWQTLAVYDATTSSFAVDELRQTNDL